MTTRTTKAEMTFTRPFVLSAYDEALPAGTYDVEIDEQLLDGVSFPAYRRVAALLYLPVAPGRPHHRQILTVDPNELDEALARDQAAALPPVQAADTGLDTGVVEANVETPPARDGGRSAEPGTDDTVMVRW